MSERSGIEIDYCPECRGVWLDRGELDKILDRARSELPTQASPAPQPPTRNQPSVPFPQPAYEERRDRGYDRERPYETPGYGYRKKKENWLSELFD